MLGLKRTFVFFVLAISALSVMYQSSRAQLGFKIGAVAGEDFTGSQTLPSPFPGSTAQGASGYILGLMFDKDLLGPFSLETELLVTQRSFSDAVTFPNSSPNASNAETWAEKLTYLQIPILLKISPIDGSFSPYVFVGPNIGFKLSASAITDSTGQSQTADQNTLFKTLDLGLDAGGGLSVKVLPFLFLFADVRYTFGLVDVYNNVTTSGAGDLKSRDIKWTGGLMFGF